MDIAKLVQKAKSGNDEAFEQLISSVRNKLYQTAFAYVRNEQDALDIYQDTIYQAYISLHTLKKPESFQSWIVKMSVFKSIDFIRKESRHFLADETVFQKLMSTDKMESLAHSLDLSEAFKLLDPQYKTIILLRYYHDLSVKDIAKIIGCPKGTVKSYLHRAKKQLKPILREGYMYE
ncbi:sigma-70 family RNA polymerase sigma factor [Pueribacillus sp. YX66]|uniref:sigma-70 family RNA polymerase sigma factor n=1 Tax=Pueribacillus sp. YX66 TaxID=3229242 RepID=UPI00358D1B7B